MTTAETDTQPQEIEIGPDSDAPQPRRLGYGFSRRFGVILDDPLADPPVFMLRRGFEPRRLAEARRWLGGPCRIRVVEEPIFDRRLREVHEAGAAQAMSSVDGLDAEVDLHRVVDELREPEDLLDSSDDAPIIRLINALFTEAIREDASDIHIEPYENRLRIRFRVDGALKEVLRPDRKLAPPIVSRIKVMAKLDIAEKRLPQDGRMSLRLGGRGVDVRVSTIPAGTAEKVVLRLLDRQNERLDLEQLGMPRDLRGQIEEAIQRPHGILLITGPTGSGKTTTLYAMLERLNDQKRNIMTVEDPIEYFLDGINQTQVNVKIGMTFASGLRSILRQDPDVIMVGEIRDLETAQIAVQASLTGHTVFSTLHTNTAIGAITRLRDMGVEPFLLATSLIGVMAQRLVRLLCVHCREAYSADAAQKRLLGVPAGETVTLYHAQGCAKCGNSGYRRRTGIYEYVPVDAEMQTLIHSGAGERALLDHARAYADSIHAIGSRLVLSGRTTLDELIRV
ncbi:MAG: type II secretion system ATPase GspE, partial [Pseudomonadota bacterium]